MAFNDERVVRRIAACRVPVVSAVGHEVDTTLADLVADVRAATPSQAAELVVPDDRARSDVLARGVTALVRSFKSRLMEDRSIANGLRGHLTDPRSLISSRKQRLDELLGGIERRMLRRLRGHGEMLQQSRSRLLARHPRAVATEARGILERASLRLAAAARLQLERRGASLGQKTTQLHSLSPLSVLGRGYAIALRGDGSVVRSTSEVEVGDELGLRLAEGSVDARVTGTRTLSSERGGS
jgi:exodeoxyribonuclease VII large subunit